MKYPAMILGIVALFACMLAGCARLANHEVGKEEFESKCATCHGTSGKGDGPQSVVTKAADLTQLAKKNGGVFPTQRVYEIIDGRREVAAHGPRTMPVWGRFFQVDVPDLPQGVPESNFSYRETSVHNKIQWLIDYLVRLQELN